MKASFKITLAIILYTIFPLQIHSQTFAHDDTVSVYTMYGTIYADMFIGRKTANGEIYTQEKFTAAHWKFKFGTLVLVTNINTGEQVIVRINDRCPKRGVLDLTRRAANSIGIKGCQKVNVQVLPERYYERWQKQDGSASSAIKPPHKAASDGVNQNKTETKQKDSTSASPKSASVNTKKEIKKKPTTSTKYPDLYNIQICTVDNRTVANKAISKLPYYYQNKATLVTENNKITVIVNTSMQHPQAQKSMTELKQIFPESKLVKITKK